MRQIAGKPLIAHSIEQAKQSKVFDLIAVSSDSPEILKISAEYGADIQVNRPKELATDNSPKVPAIRHCVEQVELKTNLKVARIIDLDATSPLRLPDDIKEAFGLLSNKKIGNLITGYRSKHSPYFSMVQLTKEGAPQLVKRDNKTYVRRQDTPDCFSMNGSIFGWQRHVLAETDNLFNKNTRLLVMPEDRSIDIDSPLDFEIVSFLLANRLQI